MACRRAARLYLCSFNLDSFCSYCTVTVDRSVQRLPGQSWQFVANGRVTMTTESIKNTCAYPLTNQTLNVILTLTLTLLLNSTQ